MKEPLRFGRRRARHGRRRPAGPAARSMATRVAQTHWSPASRSTASRRAVAPRSAAFRLENCKWFDDPERLAVDPSIDVFVELIGGEEGVAKQAVEAALKAGKHVVTANKALLAWHGTDLARLAEKHGVALNFEAAVAGAIPDHQDPARGAGRQPGAPRLRHPERHLQLHPDQDAGRSIGRSPTCSKEAQAKGYAEADPTFDIGGFDTAHKLALLTSLAFGTRVAFDQIHVEGIQSITQADIEAADDLGYRIKLLGRGPARPRAASSSACIQLWYRSIPPSLRSPASRTAWPWMAISPAPSACRSGCRCSKHGIGCSRRHPRHCSGR